MNVLIVGEIQELRTPQYVIIMILRNIKIYGRRSQIINNATTKIIRREAF